MCRHMMAGQAVEFFHNTYRRLRLIDPEGTLRLRSGQAPDAKRVRGGGAGVDRGANDGFSFGEEG